MTPRSNERNDIYLIYDISWPEPKPTFGERILKTRILLLCEFFHFDLYPWYLNKDDLLVLLESFSVAPTSKP